MFRAANQVVFPNNKAGYSRATATANEAGRIGSSLQRMVARTGKVLQRRVRDHVRGVFYRISHLSAKRGSFEVQYVSFHFQRLTVRSHIRKIFGQLDSS